MFISLANYFDYAIKSDNPVKILKDCSKDVELPYEYVVYRFFDYMNYEYEEYDTEACHRIADEVLCSLVSKDIATEYNKLPKWYT